MGETYKIKFITPGQFITYNNKRYRTPVVFEGVSETDIQFFDVQARTYMIKYNVKKISDILKDPFVEELVLDKDEKNIVIEELSETRDPSSILGKLLKNSNRIGE